MYKNLIIALLVALFGANLFADIAISEVKVFSGYPWKEVIIGYKITGVMDAQMAMVVRATDNTSGITYDGTSLEGVSFTEGTHVIKWDASHDNAKFKSDDVRFSVRLVKPMYCIVDLSNGENATNYPVSYLEHVPREGWGDVFKTTKLVLRRIEAGTYVMGSTRTSDNLPHQVTLTRPFYIGVFEVTQRQYQLVTGGTPSYFGDDNMKPVESVDWSVIRGAANWPYDREVSSDTFIGRIRARTGMEFDLPTEAQWEYACRAGTSSLFNNGGDTKGDLRRVGRFGVGTQDNTARVGSYRPNAWGLYDMHGNVREWCLDGYAKLTEVAIDPEGAGGNRISRGGSWNDAWREDGIDCSSCWRYAGYELWRHGFRLACALER